MNGDQRRAARLRSTLAAVADHHDPDPTAWTRIHDRAQRGAVLTGVAADPGRPRTRARLLAAAAVLVAVAAVGAGLLATRDDTTSIATAPETEPTGWYIPVGLPDGWSVRSVSVQRMDDDCPCRTTVWADATRDVAVTVISEPTPAADDGVTVVESDDATAFAVAEGIVATVRGSGGAAEHWDVEWVVDGRHQVVSTIGVPRSAIEDLARTVFGDPASEAAPIDGVDLVETWSEPGEVAKEADVKVELKAPTGHIVDLSLASDHRFSTMAGSLVPSDGPTGQPLPLLTLRTPGTQPADQGGRVRDYIGRWPGGSVRVLGGFDGQSSATDEEIATVAAALRPADLAQWRAFVATAADRDRSSTASATLQDLIDGRTTAPAAPVASSGDLTDLEYELTAEPRIGIWEDAGAVLTVRNPTEDTITDPACSIDRATLAFTGIDSRTVERLGANARGTFPERWADDGPCDGGLILGPGATKTLRLVIRAQYLDARYGPLPAGNYLLTAQIGKVQDNVEVEIGPADCPADASPYEGLTQEAAAALARERGDEVRIPAPGPESDVSSQVCNRVNLIVEGGTVDFARYY